MTASSPLLEISNLRVVFEILQGKVSLSAINNVNLVVNESEVLGLVGESGCGKSSLALCIIGLLPKPPAKVLSGKISFQSQNLLEMNEKDLESIRGTGISMIFQEPLTSLNPLFTVGDQLSEAIRIRIRRDRKKRNDNGKKKSENERNIKTEAATWLKRVGLPDPENSLERYPHELSGGMRQRVMTAMALAERSALILADEPTSALDVTIQAQILKLLRSLVSEYKTSVLFISHDLAVVAQVADRVAVMYAGMIMEEAPVKEIFANPLHPYTKALMNSYPGEGEAKRQLETIPGSVPNLSQLPSGCPFHPRCKFAMPSCQITPIQLKEISKGHKVACLLY